MKNLKVLFFILAGFCAACSVSPRESSADPGLSPVAIIGGAEVSAENPLGSSIVAVYDANNKTICTGTLMGSNTVLTAAHCVYDNADLVILFAKNLTSTRDPSQKLTALNVDGMELTPQWNANGELGEDRGDLVLLHFAGTAPDGYLATELLPATEVPQRSDIVTVAGFGLFDLSTNTGTGLLRATTLTVDNPAYNAGEALLDQSQGKGACHGDSGGPVFVQKQGQYFLWGVISRGSTNNGDDCAQLSIVTKVPSFADWLAAALARLQDSTVSTNGGLKSPL